MLRMIPTTGSVIIDGIRTENINLHALRTNVTIIPQDPVSRALTGKRGELTVRSCCQEVYVSTSIRLEITMMLLSTTPCNDLALDRYGMLKAVLLHLSD